MLIYLEIEIFISAGDMWESDETLQLLCMYYLLVKHSGYSEYI